MEMTRILLFMPSVFAVADAIPGVDGIGGLVLQFGAFSVVCLLVWWLVTKRMPEIERQHQEEREAAAARREARDRESAAERARDREMFKEALEKITCKYRDFPGPPRNQQ